MFCQKCGAQFQPDFSCCKHCGAPASNAPHPPPPGYGPTPVYTVPPPGYGSMPAKKTLKEIIGVSFTQSTDETRPQTKGYVTIICAAMSFVLAILPVAGAVVTAYLVITNYDDNMTVGFLVLCVGFGSALAIPMDVIAIFLGKSAVRNKPNVLTNIILIFAWIPIFVLLGFVIYIMIFIGIMFCNDVIS